MSWVPDDFKGCIACVYPGNPDYQRVLYVDFRAFSSQEELDEFLDWPVSKPTLAMPRCEDLPEHVYMTPFNHVVHYIVVIDA
jgi:hypothetical protein